MIDNPASVRSQRLEAMAALHRRGCCCTSRSQIRDINRGTTAVSWGHSLFMVGDRGITVHV